MQHLLRRLSLLVLCAGFAGCAAFEALGGVPYAESSMTFASGPTTAKVLDCVQSSILALSPEKETRITPDLAFKARQGHWATNVTVLDAAAGVLETGHYPDSNVQGVRLRAVYTPSESVLRLQLKAAGPYYSDLGAQSHMNQLRSQLSKCVES